MGRWYVERGAYDLRRIKGLLFSLHSLFWLSIRHLLFSSLYLLHTEYQSRISLFFIEFVFLPSYLFVSIKVFGSPTFRDRIHYAPNHFVENGSGNISHGLSWWRVGWLAVGRQSGTSRRWASVGSQHSGECDKQCMGIPLLVGNATIVPQTAPPEVRGVG